MNPQFQGKIISKRKSVEKKVILPNSDFYKGRINEADVEDRLKGLACKELQAKIAKELMNRIRSNSEDITELFEKEVTVLNGQRSVIRKIAQEEMKKRLMKGLFIIVRETANERYVRVRDIA